MKTKIPLISLCISFILVGNYSYSIKKRNTNKISFKTKTTCNLNRLYINELDDSFHEYFEKSFNKGIKKNLNSALEIKTFVNRGILEPIRNSKTFYIDKLKHSYAYLTPNSKNLLINIGTNFQQKLKNTNLKKTKIIVSSLLRTKESVYKLRNINKTAIKQSAHLHGTTFDISCSKFRNKKRITKPEIESLKEILAKILFDLKKQKKCWVTYEKYQSCFHIVNR
jgi:uncharacterized protein YcbK (DUF882 family)